MKLGEWLRPRPEYKPHKRGHCSPPELLLSSIVQVGKIPGPWECPVCGMTWRPSFYVGWFSSNGA